MNRELNLAKLIDEKFDVLVIGGGITGAGIALDAALRGMKVGLIDRQDFAAGTSSRSTKLVHGGLRYLVQGDFGLVYEVGRERRIVHAIAPHLVHPDRMLMPLIQNGNHGYWITKLGLSIYDLLAGVAKSDRKRMLSKQEALKLEPLLDVNRIVGGGFYAEYRTDDARLTFGLIRTAVARGAVAVNYISARRFEYSNKRISGLVVFDEESKREFTIHAKHVVGAAGPWTDALRYMDDQESKPIIRHTKGVHIVVSRNRLRIKHTVYFDNEDKRMLFAIPRDNKVYIGTTDTFYNSNLDLPSVTAKDVDYLLEGANYMFPSVNLNREDIESSWAGIRPLIEQPGKTATTVSRKDEVYESKSGLIVIAGGKLTGYRKMAERVVNRVGKKMGNTNRVMTDRVQLEDAGYLNYNAVENHINMLMERWGHILLDPHSARHLVHTFGRSADKVLEYLPEEGTPEERLLTAEIRFCVRHEMVIHSRDYYDRRSGRLYFNIDSLKRNVDFIIRRMALEIGWTEKQMMDEGLAFEEDLRKVTSFSDSE